LHIFIAYVVKITIGKKLIDFTSTEETSNAVFPIKRSLTGFLENVNNEMNRQIYKMLKFYLNVQSYLIMLIKNYMCFQEVYLRMMQKSMRLLRFEEMM
jgi:hypothetical protein